MLWITMGRSAALLCILAVASCADSARTSPVTPTATNAPVLEAPYPEVAAAFDTLAADGFRGAIAFRAGDGPLRVFVHGAADCDGRRALDRGTRFDIGSITKALTGAAILKLIEQGRLSPDTKLSKLFPQMPPDKADITVMQLLTHTAGLPDSLGEDETYVSRAQYLEMAFAAPLLFPPGEKEEYSNVGFSLLGAEIETVTGQRYETALRELVLTPAGVPGIGYLAGARRRNACGLRDGQSWGSTRDYFGVREPSWHLVGNGGLLATPEELTSWFDAVFQGKVLNAAGVAQFDQIMRRTDRRGRPVRVSSGSNMIFSALYLNWPDQRTVATIMTSDSTFQKEKVTPVLNPAINALFDRTSPPH